MSAPLAHTAADDATMLAAALESLAGAVRELAHKVDDLVEDGTRAPTSPWRTRPVTDLPRFSPTIAFRLANADIRTVGELVARAEDLPRLKNLGPKAVHRICMAALAALADA